jgi:hypothetical protein
MQRLVDASMQGIVTERRVLYALGKNRIMICGPKTDGTYVVEFRTAKGETLAISIPSGKTAVLRYFQERMPMGCSCQTFREEPLARRCVCQVEPS